MCGYVQLCVAMCSYVWLCVAMCGYVQLWVAVCSYVWLCVAVCGYVWLCVALSSYERLCVAMCSYVWLCVAMCSCVWLYVAMGSCVWLCVVMCSYVQLCVAICSYEQLCVAICSYGTHALFRLILLRYVLIYNLEVSFNFHLTFLQLKSKKECEKIKASPPLLFIAFFTSHRSPLSEWISHRDVPSFFGHVVGYKLSRVALGTRMSLRLYSYFSFRLGFRHFSAYDSFLN